MTMKVLIYSASSLCNPQFGIQMEHAIERAQMGDEVVFCHCAGLMSACSANPLNNKAYCEACKIGFKCGLQNLPSKIKIIAFKKKDKDCQILKKFKSISDIKNYVYKGVNVGFSVMSVYTSKTRNPNPRISTAFLICINNMITEAERLVDSAIEVIKVEKPDLIIYFNGRFFDTKPFHDLAEQYKINYITTENIGGVRAGEKYKIMQYCNTIPHDTVKLYENCLRSWENTKRTAIEKIRIGQSFYEKRRNGQQAGDYVYTSSQKLGALPKNYDSTKKNIVIFTSSEDEYSSVSNKVDQYYIFSSQYDCIKYLSENIEDDSFHFIVRIHPNMRGLNVDYHNNLYLLREKKNVTIISPEDDTSSYTLLDIAYNIVVFGSTIGAEAIYWGKPVVLLGFAAYYEWNCCSIPTDKQEVIEAVKKPKLYPFAKETATKYGYYFLENNIAQESKYININPITKKLLGHRIHVFEYLRILGSSVIFKLVSTFFTRILGNILNNKNKFPERIIH